MLALPRCVVLVSSRSTSAVGPNRAEDFSGSRQACRAIHAEKPINSDHVLQTLRLGPEGGLDGPRAAGDICIGSVTLTPDVTGGVFDVRLDGEMIWSRKDKGRFPDIKEIKRLVRDGIAPGRSLGHVDKP